MKYILITYETSPLFNDGLLNTITHFFWNYWSDLIGVQNAQKFDTTVFVIKYRLTLNL